MKPLFVPRDGLPSQLTSIQILRAVAVLAVTVYHITVIYPDPHTARHAISQAAYFGYAGVDLFFLISGFIIMHVTRRGDVRPAPFLLKRAIRILPLYWATTTAVALLWLVRPGLVPLRGENAELFLMGSYTLTPMRERPLLGVGWTLQHEFIFYALFAILLLFNQRRLAIPLFLSLGLVSLVFRTLIDPGLTFWDFKLLSPYHLEFALGIVAYQLATRYRATAPGLLIAVGLLLAASTAHWATPLMEPSREVPVVAHGAFGAIRVVGFGLASLLLILAATGCEDWLTSARSRSVAALKAIGDASFAIYLTHNLVLQACAIALRALGSSVLTTSILAVPVVVLTLLVGALVHRLVELPMLSWTARMFGPVRTPAATS